MHLAQVPFIARLLVTAPFFFGAFTVIAAIIIGAELLGVPDEAVAAIATVLIGVYAIIRFRLVNWLRPEVDPLFICENCHRRVKPKRDVQSNNTLERT